MREYIPRVWTYGKAAWNRTKWLIRDYDRLMRDRQDILFGGRNPPDGQPRGRNIGKPTEDRAVRLIRLCEELEALDQASAEMRGGMSGKVQEEFDPVRAYWSYDYFNYKHIRADDNDQGPSESTWKRYKVSFMLSVAKKAKII